MSAAAQEDLIAQAVADEINAAARSWAALPNPATAGYDNQFEQEELATLRVVVIPLKIQSERLNRKGDMTFKYGVTIDLQQHLASADRSVQEEAIQGLNYTAERIADWFRDGHKLTTTVSWRALDVQRPFVFVPEVLWQHRTWESYIEIEFEGIR